MMKKILLLIGCCLFFTTSTMAQAIGVKTNLAGWCMYGTINAGLEPALAPRLTLAVDGYYNPFTHGDAGRSTKLWGVQPELRYWLKSKYAGLYIGINSLYTSFDYGMNKYRYDGDATGVGLGIGYSLPVCERLRVTAGVGGGWLHRDYEKSGIPQYPTDIIFYGNTVKNSFGCTKAEISVQFIIR